MCNVVLIVPAVRTKAILSPLCRLLEELENVLSCTDGFATDFGCFGVEESSAALLMNRERLRLILLPINQCGLGAKFVQF